MLIALLSGAYYQVPNEIISHNEMCRREGRMLQAGMSFGVMGTHTVILMSVRPNAPYQDTLLENDTVIIYEGHDVPRSDGNRDPKRRDQVEYSFKGTLTQNGRFYQSAQAHKLHGVPPERVRVYEKIQPNIWSYNGIFHLVDSWRETQGKRQVFKFKLVAVEGEEDFSLPIPAQVERRRIIPSAVKLEVFKRDEGKCVKCGATDELHYDHDFPFSLGGTSITADNIQLLCARHNLQKSNRIE